MIAAKRAPVRPRVFTSNNGEPQLLEDEIRRLLDETDIGAVGILGPPGSGKTMALQHLRATLPDEPLVLLDEPSNAKLVAALDGRMVIYTGGEQRWGLNTGELALYRLAPWTHDDLIEYLLSVHKPRVASVMARLQPCDHFFGGLPDVWQIILDQLAAHDYLPDAATALCSYLDSQLPDTDLVERARSVCLNALTTSEARPVVKHLGQPGFPRELVRLLRHLSVQIWLAGERIAADVCSDAACDFLARRLPRDVVKAAAEGIRDKERGIAHLRELLAGPSWSQAMAASLMLAVLPGWMPETPVALVGAYLEGALWLGAGLEGANLRETDFTSAVLRRANLKNANAERAVFRGAHMQEATLYQMRAPGADFSGADLRAAEMSFIILFQANLEETNLEDAVLFNASLVGARLNQANLAGADLTGARLAEVRIRGADFSGANLERANLSRLRLRDARFAGARFIGAELTGCDMEFMDLCDADFQGALLQDALLTGSTTSGANFKSAFLRDAKLADIDWPSADLRGADLRGATFHMGSTRSGLVGSPLACEGSRTGFYTDDFEEQYFKCPEEIRKANLCGADLRGAKLADVDFYLVDLRGAIYDSGQAEYLRHCKAILERGPESRGSALALDRPSRT